MADNCLKSIGPRFSKWQRNQNILLNLYNAEKIKNRVKNKLSDIKLTFSTRANSEFDFYQERIGKYYSVITCMGPSFSSVTWNSLPILFIDKNYRHLIKKINWKKSAPCYDRHACVHVCDNIHVHVNDVYFHTSYLIFLLIRHRLFKLNSIIHCSIIHLAFNF